MSSRTRTSGQQIGIIQALEGAHATAMVIMGQQDAVREDKEVQEQNRNPPEWAMEMRIPGVVYSIEESKAMEMGWKLFTPAAGEGNNKFVCVLPAMDNEHLYLKLADLGPDFVGIQVDGYEKESIARILACTAGAVDEFAEEWVAREWFKSATFVGPIADRAEEITQTTGWPSTKRANQVQNTAKKNAWRLGAFIVHVLQHSGKAAADVT